jgi:hypothetical protein
MLNRQMRDYFGLRLLSRHVELNIATLRTAIQPTLEKLYSEIEAAPFVSSRNSAMILASCLTGGRS